MEYYMIVVRILCSILLFMGILSVISGSLVLHFAWENLKWPANSGVGIWAGAINIIAAILGITVSLRALDKESLKCSGHFKAFHVFVSLTYSANGMLCGWSFWVMGLCSASGGFPAWCTNNQPAIVAVSAIGGILGLLMAATILPISIMGCVYQKKNKNCAV